MSKPYIVDRALHWISAVLILYMLTNMGSQIHLVDYRIKGQVEHRQEAIEFHATIGAILLLVLIGRFLWFRLYQAQIPRSEIANKVHNRFIKLTHVLLYLVVGSLALTGLMMTFNSELNLNALGMLLSDGSGYNLQAYADFQSVHLNLITAFWWLIGIHFVGAIYARR